MSKQKLLAPEEADNSARNITKSLEAPALDPTHLAIANRHLEGVDMFAIAEEFDVPADIVSSVISKKEVKAYIDNVYLNQGYMNRSKRLAIINTVVDKILEDAIETGVYTKKDLLDWMKLIKDMEKETLPKQGPGVAIQVNQTNYETLVRDLSGDK